MSENKSHVSEIDDLVRQALKDDLPPDLEEGMKIHFLELRRVMETREPQAARRLSRMGGPLLATGEWQWMRLFFGRGALAFLSVLLMVLGGAIHLSGYQGHLAGAVSLLKTSLMISEQMRRATSMECRVQMPANNGQVMRYLIRWTFPARTRVDCIEGNVPRNILWISDGTPSTFNHGDKTLRTGKDTADFMPRQLLAAAGFLSPLEMVRCLHGHWSLMDRKSKAGRGLGFFRLSCPDGVSTLLLAVDMNSHLPESLTVLTPRSAQAVKEGDFVGQVDFIWNRKIPSELLIPGAVLQSPGF